MTDTDIIEQQLSEAERLCEQSKYDEARGIVNTIIHSSESQFSTESSLSAVHRAHCYRIYGIIEFRHQEYKAANEWQLKAEALSRSVDDLSGIAKAFGNLGTTSLERAEFDQALQHFFEALRIQEGLGDRRAQAILLSNISAVYRRRSSYDKAIEYGQRALELDEALGNMVGVAGTLVSLGNAYLSMGEYSVAMEMYRRSLAISEQNGLKYGIAINNNALGSLYRRIGDAETALEHFRKSLATHDVASNLTGRASVYNNIGLTYQQIHDYDHALQYYTQALEIFESVGATDSMVGALSNIGSIYLFQKDPTLAREQFERALTLSQSIEFTEGVIVNRANIGKVLLEFGQCDEARELVHTAMDEAMALGMLPHEPMFLETLAEIYLSPAYDKRDPEMARKYLEQAIASREQQGISAVEAYANLSEAFEESGDYKQALLAQREYQRRKEQAQSDYLMHQTQLFDYRQRTERAEREQQLAYTRQTVTTNLLHKTLPPSVAERLMKGEQNIADRYDSVSILFADIVGFTPLSARTEPRVMVRMLNTLFTRFDRQTQIHGVERIKTIGDAYMVIAGAPEQCDDHAARIIRCAHALRDEARAFSAECGEVIELRIGVHCGEVVAAVVGETKFSYDVWSDAVNLAARLETYGEANRIHASDEFISELRRVGVHCQVHTREPITIKGKGNMQTYFVEMESV